MYEAVAKAFNCFALLLPVNSVTPMRTMAKQSNFLRVFATQTILSKITLAQNRMLYG